MVAATIPHVEDAEKISFLRVSVCSVRDLREKGENAICLDVAVGCHDREQRAEEDLTDANEE
jgi:hypothetical protein